VILKVLDREAVIDQNLTKNVDVGLALGRDAAGGVIDSIDLTGCTFKRDAG